MRSIVAIGLALLLTVRSCLAQNQSRTEIVIPSSPQSPMLSETCVEVEIGGEKQPSLGCLNRKLRAAVDRVAPSVNVPPIDARSPDIRVGVGNTVAVQQQYGQNFGRSVVPYRPPPPVFTNPLAVHR